MVQNRFVFLFWFLTGAMGAVIPSGCPQLSSPANGKVCYSTAIGAFATYTCNCGYALIGSGSSLCQTNLAWSHDPPTCQIIDCGVLVAPGNGALVMTTTTLGSVVRFSCDTGYRLFGDEEVVCQENSEWSAEEPICQVDCGNLVNPDNGNMDVTTTTVGGIATFSCITGYNLVGEYQLTCQENGGWSAEEPICQIITCPTLFRPVHGDLVMSATTVGSYALFSCITGYNLVGDDRLVCHANGMWSAEEPFCWIVDCGDLTDVPHGRVIMPSSPTYNFMAHYECDTGYTVSTGDRTRVCQADGNWSGTAPTCSASMNAIRCVSCQKSRFDRSAQKCRILYQNCLAGPGICNGLANVECNGTNCVCASGFEDPGNATCVAVDCGIPLTPVNGMVIYSETTYQAVVSYECNEGHVLIGSQTAVCQADGTYSPAPPTCSAIDCLYPGDLPNGIVYTPAGTTYQQIAHYTCKLGFTLTTGDQTRVCQSDGTWSGPQPTCFAF